MYARHKLDVHSFHNYNDGHIKDKFELLKNSLDGESTFLFVTKRARDGESLVKRLETKITLELDFGNDLQSPGKCLRYGNLSGSLSKELQVGW